MGRHRSRSRSYSPVKNKRYDDPRDRRRERQTFPAPSGLLVRNIPLSARPEDLRIPFERFGPLKDVYLPKDYYTGEHRGFGFVKFRYAEDAAEAKANLNHSVIGGREIRIVYAEENRKTPQEMRRITGTSNRSSFRRRSHSRSPRRRHRSYSRSPHERRHSRDHRGRNDRYSPQRSKSVSRSVSPKKDMVSKSRGRPRSVSRSPSPHHVRVSPRKDKGYKSRERPRSVSRSPSPLHEHFSPRKDSRARSRSISRSASPHYDEHVSPKKDRGFKSRARPRSISGSLLPNHEHVSSPRKEKGYKSRPRSRSISGSPLPRHEHKDRVSHKHSTPEDNVKKILDEDYEHKRAESPPGRKSSSPSKSHSRSCSPR